MACDIFCSKGVVYSVWGKPRVEDIDRVIAALREQAAQLGRKVVYITRVPEKADAPSSEFRKAADNQMPTILESCSSYHVILEGTGFIAAMKRGVLTTMFLAARKRNTFYVHALFTQVIASVPAEDRTNVIAAIESFGAKGLLKAPFPVSVAPDRRNQSTAA